MLYKINIKEKKNTKIIPVTSRSVIKKVICSLLLKIKKKTEAKSDLKEKVDS